MNKWEKVKIGDIFNLEKGFLQSSKCVPGDYDFITAAANWKTHKEFSHDCEAIIYAVAASGSLGRAHYINGKFISSDLCFIMTEKNKEKYPINFKFYQFIFSILKNDIVRKTKTGTSKEAINRKNFSNYEISYIDIKHQNLWENKLTNVNNSLENINVETENQANYLKKLRQSILQEAIEGKLTADWRKQNPVQKGNPEYDAEALLEKIKTEKEKLIKEKKIKKSKPLPPIKPDEIPFDLPVGWKWCRLENICSKIGSGSTPKGSNYAIKGYPFFRSQNVYNYNIIYNDIKYISEAVHHRMSGTKVFPNDLLLNITGGSLGRCALVPNDFQEGNVSQHVCIIRVLSVFSNFFHNLVHAPHFQQFIFNSTTGAGREGLPKYNLQQFPIPLPPLSEQREIVNRVTMLLSIVDKLEEQVTERQKQAKQLMQSVLKEAFNNNN